MEINGFIKNFAALYEEIDAKRFSESTKFKENDEWSSLTAMAVIAMVDEQYQVKLLGDDIKKSETIADIFHIVESRLK